MNKTAVALAADSAVTSGDKIYNSVNKLFQLSCVEPVGIMIYGNAEFMGIPWETIIKTYRVKLANQSEKNLEAFGDNFIQHLINEHRLFPDIERERYLQNRVLTSILPLAEDAKVISEQHESPDEAIREYIAEEHLTPLRDNYKECASLPENIDALLHEKFGAKIEVLIQQAFKETGASPETLKVVYDYCIESLYRDVFQNYSGIVIAGFGSEDVFPSLVEFHVEGMAIDEHLKFKKIRTVSISFDTNASVTPFAQKEMVRTFMTGIHPQVQATVSSYIEASLTNFQEVILDALASKIGDDRASLSADLQAAVDKILEDLGSGLHQNETEHHVNPVLDAVEILPKDELASMAESMVNLTVLKRRVSVDPETVGGPIDVAVISKGDGFIWIKRKHYFKKELNLRYLSNT